jgi:hypothetical protein
MLSNHVLSKNPSTSDFLNNYLFKKVAKHYSIFEIIAQISRYYFYSLVKFALYLCLFLINVLAGTKYNPSDRDDELIIIDTFFLTDEIIQTNKFKDRYLPGLEATLRNLKKNYAYLPCFYNLNNPFKLCRLLRVLKNNNVQFLSEFQLLSYGDLVYILYFIISYPWHVIRFAKMLDKKSGYEIELIHSEILGTIKFVNFYSFSRYLQGKKISMLPYKKIKVISWYENQVIHKNLYKGLRNDKHKVSIYGSQQFLYSKTDLNIIPDERELIHDVIPDKIIVNGPVFIPPSTKLVYKVGPSLRYKNLFSSDTTRKIKDYILVILSYDENNSMNILRVIAGSELFNKNLLIKFHPTSSIDKFSDFLSPQFKVVNDDIYLLFKMSKIVIGSASGALIETASSGIPVVVINDSKSYKYDILPEYGKGIIWDETDDSDGLMTLVNKYEKAIEDNIDEIENVANNYKKMFFCEPNEQNIIDAFDLGSLQSV